MALVANEHRGVRILRVDGGGSLAKAKGVVAAYPTIWRGTILDAGCRDQALRQALDEHPVDYVGLDINPPADVLADLDHGIPMADGEADVVVALDVLEHTNAIHFAFHEVCRVARRHVVVALPNQYELHDRWQTLCGRNRSGKFGLPLDPPSDRHRWLFGFDEARTLHREDAASPLLRSGAHLTPQRRVLRELDQRALQLFDRAWTHQEARPPGVHHLG